MKRLIASFAALSLFAVPAVAATTAAKPKPAPAKTQKAKPATKTNKATDTSKKSK
jgi:hypothetical protein